MEEEIFDSITWESPSTLQRAPSLSFPRDQQRLSAINTTISESTHDPSSPKWEGFLIPSVRDPVKELPDTRDVYVSYLVSVKVRAIPISQLSSLDEPSMFTDKLTELHNTQPFMQAEVSRFLLPQGPFSERLSSVRRPTPSRQTSNR